MESKDALTIGCGRSFPLTDPPTKIWFDNAICGKDILLLDNSVERDLCPSCRRVKEVIEKKDKEFNDLLMGKNTTMLNSILEKRTKEALELQRKEILEKIDKKVKYYRSCSCTICKNMCELADELKRIISENHSPRKSSVYAERPTSSDAVLVGDAHSPQVTNNKEVSVVSASLSDTCKNCGNPKSEHFSSGLIPNILFCTPLNDYEDIRTFTPITDEEEISSICPQCDMGVSSCLCDEEIHDGVCGISCSKCGEHYIEGVKENE